MSIGTNFCDYNRDFYKKLSLETVMTALFHEIGGFFIYNSEQMHPDKI